MTNVSSSMTMKSDNESKLVNTSSSSSGCSNTSTTTVNNNNIYFNCNKLTTSAATTTLSSGTVNSIAPLSAATPIAISDLPSIRLAPFSKIKSETDSSEHTNRQSSASSMVTKLNSSPQAGATAGATGIAINSVSAKMGSRRIFTPQFKLQVLESYRNDSDCKGNQRATARKYNIHRRQIQKWLQCESNLRSSVANISANNVKHQFHNITHQMPIVTTSTTAASPLSSSSNNNYHTHHNQQYKAINNRLSLDTTRHSVALTSIPIPTTKATQQGVLAAAAAAAAGDVGAVAPLSSPSPASTSFLSTTTKNLNAPTSPILRHPQILSKPTTVSPSTALQCAKPRGPVIGGSAMIHTQYHHDGIGMHTPPALLTRVPESVTIITHHPHTPHMHVSNLKSHYHHYHMEQQHHHHLHHHHLYSQVVAQPPLPLPPPPPPPSSSSSTSLSQQSSERRPFVPSASLPALPISSSPAVTSPPSSISASSSSSLLLSATSVSASAIVSSTASMSAAVALTCIDTLATTPAAVAFSLTQTDENRSDELRDYPNSNYPTTTTPTAVLAENRYMNENEYAVHRNELHRAFGGLHYYMPVHVHPAAAIIAPIDLSLGSKRIGNYTLSREREPKEIDHNQAYHDNLKNYNNHVDVDADEHDVDDDDDDSQLNVVDSDFPESTVVDLTLRKRRVLMPTASEPDTVTAEKHTKFSSVERDEKDNDKQVEPAKPVKLFKPYLLGDEDETDNKMDRQRDPIIWSHHTACVSPPISHDSRQCSSRGSNFQTPPVDTYPFPAGSPSFQSSINASTTTVTSLRCPKGSPVSGYESSSSIHSDSASSSSVGGDNHYNNLPHTTYSFDLKVHDINNDLPDKHLISPASTIPYTSASSNVQRWLDQESGIRQSIALYG